MAQTIQIKSSTTVGNVPSSLATGELAINVADGSLFFGSATTVYDDFRFGGLIVTGTTTLEGNSQLDGTLTVGVDDTGYDVKFFGATSGKYMLWDESHDALDVVGNLNVSGDLTANNITGVTSIESTLYTIDGQNAIDYATNTHLFGSTSKATKLRSTVGIEMASNVTVSGAISGDSTMVATTYNSTTSSIGYQLNGTKYLWRDGGDHLQVGNTGEDTDIIGISINLQTATTISDNLTVTDKVLIGTGLSATHDLDVITGSNVGIRAKTTGNNNAQLILMNTQATWTLNNKTGTADVTFGTGDGVGDFVIESDVIITGDTNVTGTTISTGGFVGALTGDRKFEKSITTDKNLAQGDIIYFGGGSTIEGDLVIMTSAATWTSAQANAVTSGTSMLGIALGTDPDVDGVLLRGTYTLDHDVGNTQGAPLYLSDSTAGQATATIPDSSGDIVRIIGYNIGDDDEIWFDPDKTWVELS